MLLFLESILELLVSRLYHDFVGLERPILC